MINLFDDLKSITFSSRKSMNMKLDGDIQQTTTTRKKHYSHHEEMEVCRVKFLWDWTKSYTKWNTCWMAESWVQSKQHHWDESRAVGGGAKSTSTDTMLLDIYLKFTNRSTQSTHTIGEHQQITDKIQWKLYRKFIFQKAKWKIVHSSQKRLKKKIYLSVSVS